MKLTLRLMLAFALVAVFAAGTTAWLGYRAASTQFEHVMMGQGQGPAWRSSNAEGMAPMMGTARGRQVLEELQGSSVLSSALAVLVALAVGGYLAVRLVRPVRALTLATRRYGLGERDVLVPVEGRDELSELARTFNDMIGQLAAKEAREQRMVADIAHELRTPLTVIKGELEALEDGLMQPEPATFRRLVEDVDVLERLVRDLRLLSLTDAGELRLEHQAFDLAELCQRALESFGPRSNEKGLKLESRLTPAPVSGDPERLRQALYNLLENAIRHSPDGGTIRLETKLDTEASEIELSDDGPGIPPEHLPHIFERFYRVDVARGRASGGSGLGLAIVQAIVRAHGGSVVAANRLEGGAVFRIRLPRVR
jgi:two-component system, OmpR family, sensor histidine kinase BaeS